MRGKAGHPHLLAGGQRPACTSTPQQGGSPRTWLPQSGCLAQAHRAGPKIESTRGFWVLFPGLAGSFFAIGVGSNARQPLLPSDQPGVFWIGSLFCFHVFFCFPWLPSVPRSISTIVGHQKSFSFHVGQSPTSMVELLRPRFSGTPSNSWRGHRQRSRFLSRFSDLILGSYHALDFHLSNYKLVSTDPLDNLVCGVVRVPAILMAL